MYFLVRWVVCCFKATISSDWVLDTDLELPMVETLRATCKLSVVVLESLYTWFLSSPPDDPTSIHKSRSKSGWVEGSSHISPSTDYYRSHENEKKIIIFNSIKIINYEIKWLNEHTIKCWAWLSTNCCTPFWRSSLRTCVSTNNSIGLGSCPRDVACKKKN